VLGGRPMTWVVGPSTSPEDVAARLEARGLTDTGDGDLLTAELPVSGLRSAADVRIEEVADARLAEIGMRLAHPESTDREIETMVDERMAYLRHPGRRGGFLVAWIGDEPVANAGYRYSADGRTVYLSGAETVERWRGRGVYQTLVGHRIDAALRRGCRYAAIRARRDTSLPILIKRGFVDHGHLPIYAREDRFTSPGAGPPPAARRAPPP
jgi:GNAT superfamily N-acetyltransferase